VAVAVSKDAASLAVDLGKEEEEKEVD